MSYYEFATEMFFSYLKPYIECIFKALPFENQIIDIKNYEILTKIRGNFNNKDVLFLTESSGRYISSFLNILRDDYGCIQFQKQSSLRKITYNPCKYSKDALINEIKINNKSVSDYLKLYHNLINQQ